MADGSWRAAHLFKGGGDVAEPQLRIGEGVCFELNRIRAVPENAELALILFFPLPDSAAVGVRLAMSSSEKWWKYL
jgi:hypothetical protein